MTAEAELPSLSTFSIKPSHFILLDSTVLRHGSQGDKILYTDKPHGRSGHRCVADGVYLYCYGGYNPEFGSKPQTEMDQHGENEKIKTVYPLFRELWRFNLTTRQWKLMPSRKGFPSGLASHSSIMFDNKYMLVFGGTSVPFGAHNENTLYICQLSTAHWATISLHGDRINAGYGQSVYLIGNDLYIFGGTSGSVFFADLHHINILTGKVTQLSNIDDLPNESHKKRYRSEMIVYDNKIYIFGGGLQCEPGSALERYIGFKRLDYFDIACGSWSSVETRADSDYGWPASGYPAARKCHTCVLYKHYVFMCGGVAENTSYGDIWRLDLHTLQWTRMPGIAPNNIYFHSAVITQGCRMLVYGGVERGPGPSQVRCSNVWEYWLDVPSLKELSWRNVYTHLLQHRARRNITTDRLIQIGVPRDLIPRLQLGDN